MVKAVKTQVSNNKKRKARQLLAQAEQAFAARQFEICEQICRRVEAIWPGNPDVANMRGVRAAEEYRFADAEALFVQAANTDPKRPEFRNNLARLYATNHLYAEAADLYRQSLALDRNSLETRLGLAMALVKSRQLDEAKEALQPALNKHPRDADVLMCHVELLVEQGDVDSALEVLDRVIERNPEHVEALVRKSRLCMEKGWLEDAETLCRKALCVDEMNVMANIRLASLKKFDKEDEDVARLHRLYQATEPGMPDRVKLSFAMGRVLESLKRYDEAFGYFKEGNDLRHQHEDFQNDVELAHMQEIMQHYTREVCARDSGLEDASQIFIVGMPRCGSTLTEQILAAHPEVTPTGESGAFVDLGLAPWHTNEHPLTLERITAFTPEEWRALGEGFLERVKPETLQTPYMTDKSLANTLYVGAIHCALPKARIIHVRRHPLDTCLSIFKTHIRGAFWGYQFNLGELGYTYRMYLRLMQHWREVLPAGVMYELDYEALVADQETETRKLLEYCGLPWDERCLQFNRAKNVVQTASIVQVRKAIYTDSLAAWKRYEKHLQPLIRILGSEYSHPPV